MPVHSLPPDVIYLIMGYLESSPNTIRACSLSVRTFRSVAQSFLGRHSSANSLDRVKELVQILKKSGFQHIRSLSLGITNKPMVLEEYWKDYLTILKIFAERRCLVRLWLWEVPFFFLQSRKRKMLKEVILALTSSINDLGSYGCHFACYQEMVSFVCAFPHCDKLYIEDCVTGGHDSLENSFAGLPQHRLSIVDLGITASSTNELLMDPSGFIEDAQLDISLLSKLGCDLTSAEGIRRIVFAASGSPIRHARFSSTRRMGSKVWICLVLRCSPLRSIQCLTVPQRLSLRYHLAGAWSR